jgi:hypothetical protein
MDTKQGISSALWDLAYWDNALWDEYSPRQIPLLFNLSNKEGNAEGDSIILQFEQNDATAPVTIYGFTIFWDELPLRKK